VSSGGAVEIGATFTQAALAAWPEVDRRLPLLAAALPHIGHFQTRNRGTICGSLCHADPSSELPLCLAVLEGEVVLQSRRGRRVLAAREFQTGLLTTARQPDEILVAARFPDARQGCGYAFREVSRRHGDFAIVALGAVVMERIIRLGVAGVAEAPAVRAWDGLDERDLPDALNDFAWELGGSDDIHATARYRRELVRRLGPKVRLVLNGEPVEGLAEPRMLLTDFLRHEVGATGTHVGCEHGVCGACTILVDGEAVRACLMLAVQAEGKTLDTVEGLAGEDERLSALQAAFHRHFALQCGYCTPGFLMTLAAYLKHNRDPSESDIRTALSGNICRCTGYAEIVAAALAAARESRGKPAQQER
jgi:2-furoyl-CoA dehydrogenase FAD binding subunit